MPETTIQSQPQSKSSVQSPGPGELTPSADLVDYVKEYAREKPEVAALWCLGVGFVLGWKLKPW